jgi:putative salt-induced outer membrane protein YdiY
MILALVRRLPWALACLLGSAVAAPAGTWVLTNGDRISGEQVGEGDDFIEVLHPQLGRLKLSRALWHELEQPAPHPGAEVAVTESPEEPAAQEHERVERRWKRQVELGFVQQSGSADKQDLALRLQLDGHEGPNTYRATGRVLRSDADGATVTDRREADFRWRYDLSKRLFTQALTTYAEDAIRQIDLSLEQQVGGGYRLIDRKRHQANVGLGAVVQYLQRPGVENHTTLLGNFFQDYTYNWNSHMKLTQESNVMVADSGSIGSLGGTIGVPGAPSEGNYRVKFNTGLQSKVTSNMSFNLRFEYDYDHSIPETDLRADQRLTTSLGYVW